VRSIHVLISQGKNEKPCAASLSFGKSVRRVRFSYDDLLSVIQLREARWLPGAMEKMMTK